MKKIIVFFLALSILASPLAANASAKDTKEEAKTKEVQLAPDERKATPSGEKVRFNGQDIKLNSYLINRSNYIKIRDVAALLKGTKAKFKVDYDAKAQNVIITKGADHDEEFTYNENMSKDDKVAKPNSQKILDSTGATIELKGYFIEGNNYFRLRDLGMELGFGVAYDFNTHTVIINSEEAKIDDIFEEGYFTAPINKIKTKAGEQDIRFMIYGFEECPYCQRLKAYLDAKGIKYLTRDIRDCEGKKDEILKEYYSELYPDSDRVYYPTHIITLEKDGKSINKCVVGFTKEDYDEIFKQIEENTYFE